MTDEREAAALPVPTGGLTRRKELAGAVLLAVALPGVVAALISHREQETLATPVLLVLLAVVVAALVGGLRVALPGAIVGALVLNWFFIKPYGTLAINSADQVVVLAVYLAVAVAVSVVAGTAARRAVEATRARAEAQALSALAGATLSDQQDLAGILERVRIVFGMHQAALLERKDGQWQTVMTVGEPAHDEPGVDVQVPAGRDLALVVSGPEMFAEDRRVLTSFAEAAATSLQSRRMAERAAEAASYAAADRTRTALLAAVGHDLRTPLAGVKAAASSLRQDDVTWAPEEVAEFLATIEESADRLHDLVSNLLDASRLQVGVVLAQPEPVGLDEAVGRALLGLAGRERVIVEVPDTLPALSADAGLLERVLANLMHNALRYSPASTFVTVRGTVDGDRICCEVIDHGPGVPEGEWPRLFGPFQHPGDRLPGGTGLGLAVAAGFTTAMHGELSPEQTPGGGLTMRLSLPRAGRV